MPQNSIGGLLTSFGKLTEPDDMKDLLEPRDMAKNQREVHAPKWKLYEQEQDAGPTSGMRLTAVTSITLVM